MKLYVIGIVVCGSVLLTGNFSVAGSINASRPSRIISSISPGPMTPLQSILSKKRIAGVLALHETKELFQRFLNTRGQAALDALVLGWDSGEQAGFKKELTQIDPNIKVEILNNNIIIKSASGVAKIQVLDAISGLYLINGERVQVTPSQSYKQISLEVEAALERSDFASFSILSLLVSKANANPIGLIRVAVAFLRSISWRASAKYISKDILVPLGSGLVGASLANNYAADPFAMKLAYYNQERTLKILCENNGLSVKYFDKSECSKIKNEMTADILKSNEIGNFIPVPDQRKIGKCAPIENGFAKDGGIIVFSGGGSNSTSETKAQSNGEQNRTRIESTHDLRFEYIKNPNDPTKLLLRTMLEQYYSPTGQFMGYRVWTFINEDEFRIQEYQRQEVQQSGNAYSQHASPGKRPFTPMASVVPKDVDCTGKKLKDDELCKRLNNGLFAAAKIQKDCNVDNPEEMIRALQQDINSQRR